MTALRYAPNKKWKRERMNSILSFFVLAIVGILSFGKVGMIYSALVIVVAVAGLIRALHFFRLPHKDYLIIEDHSLSIYRGNILPRKRLLYDHVKHVALVNEVIVFKLDDEQEEAIYTDFLSSADQLKLKESLKGSFASKVVGF